MTWIPHFAISEIIRQRSIDAASQSSKDASQSIVSWPSLFWPIVAAFLNLLVQNAGAVAGHYPNRLYLRTSPAVCVVDTGLCVVKFCWFVVLGCSPRTAARHVWNDRFEDAASQQYSVVDKLWPVTMIAFAIGIIPQAIKVWAMRGVPVTQGLMGVAFVSFIVPEVFRLVAGPAHAVALETSPRITKAKAQMEHLVTWTFFFGLVSQYAIWSYVTYEILPSHWFLEIREKDGQSVKTPGLATLTVFEFICGLISVIIWLTMGITFIYGLHRVHVWLFGYESVSATIKKLHVSAKRLYSPLNKRFEIWPGWLRKTTARVLKYTAFTVGAVLVVSIGFAITMYVVYKFAYACYSNPRAVAMAIRILVAALIPVVGLIRTITRGLSRRRERSRFSSAEDRPRSYIAKHFGSFMFLCLNVGSLVAYYALVYSSEGTYKPAWTEKLG